MSANRDTVIAALKVMAETLESKYIPDNVDATTYANRFVDEMLGLFRELAMVEQRATRIAKNDNSFLQDAEIHHGLSDAAKVVRNKILFIRGAYAKGEYTRLASLFDSVENEMKELVRKQILYLTRRTTPMEIDG